jgi:hypothetical protein
LKAHPTWFSQLFQSLRQHHPLAGYRVIGDNHFTHGNADSNHRANFIRQTFIMSGIGGLESKRCGNGIRHPGEFGD